MILEYPPKIYDLITLVHNSPATVVNTVLHAEITEFTLINGLWGFCGEIDAYFTMCINSIFINFSLPTSFTLFINPLATPISAQNLRVLIFLNSIIFFDPINNGHFVENTL